MLPLATVVKSVASWKRFNFGISNKISHISDNVYLNLKFELKTATTLNWEILSGDS